MKLLFKQRVFSWLDSYDIYDECINSQRKGAYVSKFEIYLGEQYPGCIQKELTFTRNGLTKEDWKVMKSDVLLEKCILFI